MERTGLLTSTVENCRPMEKIWGTFVAGGTPATTDGLKTLLATLTGLFQRNGQNIGNIVSAQINIFKNNLTGSRPIRADEN